MQSTIHVSSNIFVSMVMNFSNMCGNFSGVIRKILPMLPSIAHIPYLLHALMTALHMFFMAWFIQISTRILLLSHLKFLEAIQAQMGEVRIFSILYFFCLVVEYEGEDFKREQQQLLKKNEEQQFDWFYYYFCLLARAEDIIKYSHYITHPPTSISVRISVLNPTLKPIIQKTWFETQMGPSIVLLTKFLCERLTSLSLSAPIMILLYNNLFT